MSKKDSEMLQPGLDVTALLRENDLNDPVAMVERVWLITAHWADFHLYIVAPHIEMISPPIIIHPDSIPGTSELEHVYPIIDEGYKLSTSKAEEMYSAGRSMCRLYYTIEKMIAILIERLKSGGIGTDVEVQVAFGGHLLAQRKAFECIINLVYNVVVTNFDPGVWGEHYLETVKRLADKGYGYPSETPRDSYKQSYEPSTPRIKG